MEIEEIFGLPAHPLLVHAPVVLLPLGAIGVLLMVIRVAWFERYKWATLAVVGAGALGAVLAAGSGEELEDEGRRRVGDHAEAGEAARSAALVFFLVVLLAVALPIVLRRVATARAARSADGSATAVDPASGTEPDAAPAGAAAATRGTTQPLWLRIVVSVALVASAAGAVATVVVAGHSGAEEVWENEYGDGGRREYPGDGYQDDDD